MFYINPHHKTAPILHCNDIYGKPHTYSFQDFFSISANTAQILAAQGFKRGDVCAFLAPNTLETVLLLNACLQAGFTAMPISPRFPIRLQKELVHRANARFATITGIKTTQTGMSVLPIKEFFGNQDATILCSSGSTGIPKMFLHTAQQHAFSALGSAENTSFGEGDCWLASLPFYHVGGYAIFFRALVGGASIALPDYSSFDVTAFTQVLERFPITHCSLVATQLFYLLRSEEAMKRLQGLKAILLGGSAIPESLIEQALERGLRIFTSYGCTEMASQITTTIAPEREHLRTSGNVLKHREIRISEEGEILVRGATLAKGRLTEQGIMSLLDETGWYHTGDIGEFDALERLIVRGRRDNMFISGGENIYPEAIEKALLERSDISQAIIVPVPHEIYGFRPFAFVQTIQSHNLDNVFISELRTYLSKVLPRFAVPDTFVSFPEEMLSSGIKPSRKQLQQLALSIVQYLPDGEETARQVSS